MTKYIIPKKVITNPLAKSAYKTFIIVYSFYIAFSAQVFALEVDAPLGGQSFTEVQDDEAAVLERRLQLEKELKIAKIRAYYARYNLPLQNEAEHFVNAAERYDIDWRLVAAIGFIESTGGKFACSTADYSAFGWGSCKIDFDSYEHSIDVISMNLGGHNPNTDQWYKDKDIEDILQAYNPDHIRPGYTKMVMKQMKTIDAQK